MAVLYDRSVTWGGLVVGTGNKTESLIGYTTLFGDSRLRVQPDRRPVQEPGPPARGRASACPDAIVRKAPSADLWPGQTDETEGGFSYPVLDRLLFWRVDKRRSIEEMVALGLRRGDRSSGSTGWSPAPSSSARSRRSPSSGRGRPASTTSTRAGGRARRAGEPAAGAASATVAGGTLYVVATPIGNLGDVTLRALEVLRAVPLIAAEDTRHTRRLLDSPRRSRRGRRATTPGAAPARRAALLEHLRGGADLALVTDAGTPAVERPGRGPRSRRGPAEGGTVVPIPGASAVLAAVAASGRGRAALVVRGLPAAVRARAPRAARADRRRRRAGRSSFEAPGRVAATLRDLAAACGAGSTGARSAASSPSCTRQIVRGSLGDLAARPRTDRIPRAREFVLVVGTGGANGAERARAGSRQRLPTRRRWRPRLELDAVAAGMA